VARILFLTQVLPYPLDSGAKIRAYYVLRHLAQQHEVTLVSFVRADDRPDHVAHLERFCQAVYTVPMRRSHLLDVRALVQGLRTGQPFIICRDWVPSMAQLLDNLLITDHASRITDFDVVHADQTSMAQYALYARAQAQRRPKALLDAHNALYRIPRRLAGQERNPFKRALFGREAQALARYETDVYRRFDHVVFVADQDRQVLQERIADLQSPISDLQSQFTTIPICIDPEEQPLVQRVPHPCAITHLGTMFWPPNIEGVLWFAREVWPRVLEQVPDARLTVIGKNPPLQISNLKSQSAIRNIEVTGYVEDPTPYLAETAAFIVPLHSAGGMRVKILDGWCWGVPIVSTSIGAEGIVIRDGDNILIADTVEAFAQAVVSLLQEPTLGERLRQNGRRWVEERYNWQRVYANWDVVYRSLTGS